MEAFDNDDAGGAAGGAGDQGGQGGPGGPEGQAGAGAGGGGGGGGAIPRRGPGREAAPAAGWPPAHPNEFVLRVPFLCPIEAEAARRALAAYEEPHLQGVQKELSVDGSFLIVRWTAEDSRCLQVSVRSFLDDLALVQQVMQRFGPLFPPMSLPGKGG